MTKTRPTLMGWTIVHEEQGEGVSGHKVRAENRDKPQIIKGVGQAKEVRPPAGVHV